MRLVRRSFVAAVSVVGFAFAACATLPPAQPATDLKQIAGKWEGDGRCDQFYFSSRLTITQDGRWENIINPPSPRYGPRFVGAVRLSEGTFVWNSETTGATGTYTLHQGGGKTTLVVTSAGCYARLVPSKQ